MTVRKREYLEETEPEQIPPHLVETLQDMNSGNGGQWPVPEMIEPEPQLDPSAEYRLDILGRAAHIVTRDRNLHYGPPEQSFERIAAMWAAYLGMDTLLSSDVAAMLALLKIARIAVNPLHEDSWVDLAGYAACGADVARTLDQEQGE